MTQNPMPIPALLRLVTAFVAAAPLLVACGGGGGAADPLPPLPVAMPVVTSATAGAAVYGQPLLLTVNGTSLDQPLSVTSAGCTSITRSTVAPNISSAATAYYTCTVAAYGAQQFSVSQSGATATLATAAYTVPAPAVSAATAAATAFGQTVLLTLTGSGLDLPMTVSSAGCTGIARSTTAPNISSAATAYYSCTASGYGAQQFSVSRSGDAVVLGSAAFVVPAQVTAAATGAPVYGQSLLLTLTGAGLDVPLVVTSPGCTGIARSTTAPNISSATTAYYTCTVAGYGAQQFTVTQGGVATALRTAAYTVPAPQVATSSAVATSFGMGVLLTLNGSGLDLPLTVTSAGCTGITRSTSAPNISTATTAYYTCTAAVAGAQQFAVTRAGDNLSLATTSYTVPPAPVVSAASAGAPRYSQPLLLTLTGTNLDQPMTVTSPGCNGIVRSTTAPNISTATTAYYTCTVAAVGAQQFVVVRTYDNANLASAAYTVPVPQVTMTVSNGAAVNGSFVITLAPQQAPITVNNFLKYVKAGFYNGTVFHRNVPSFVLQGGGFAAGLNPANPVPALKATDDPIVLEDNAGLSNTRWTLAMARTSNPDTATSQFFVNMVDNLFLNRNGATRGYAVFGTVSSGTAFVATMVAAPCVRYPALLEDPRFAWDGTCLPSPNLVVTGSEQTQ